MIILSAGQEHFRNSGTARGVARSPSKGGHMKKFLELKCRPWIFGSGALAFLTLAVFLPCYSGGGTTLSGAVFSAVTICSFLVLFWVGVLRLFNPPREPELLVIERQACEQPARVDEREKELCKV
jgi:hypothetical protein